MFIKLVVLILVCGSSGVGLLSVRQSRLQAAHEMAEARHRSRRLDERAGEIRTQIAQACTPGRVIELLKAQDAYDPAVHHPALFGNGFAGTETEAALEIALDIAKGMENDPPDPIWMDDVFKAEHSWILDDGSRVILLND